MNTAKKLSIRLEAVGGDKVRQEFKNIGSDGQKAFQRITQVITPANDNLKVLDNTAKAFNNTLKQAVSLVGAYLGLRGLTNTFKSIVETNKEFERLSGSLKTVTGSAKAAKEAFTLIEDFATSTPFQLDEIVDSFIRLKAMGLEPSMEALTSYGNTASAFGKNILEFVSAVTSATVGEFERLKTFGIKAKLEGERVRFIFQGVTTEVGKNAAEIENYLRSIGTINFGGAMAEQMNTMGGTMSNIEDALAKVARTIGENGLNKAIKEVLDQFNNLISGTDGAAKTIGETLASAATIAGKAFFTLGKYIEPIITLLTVRLGASLITKGIDLLKASVYALNVALMGTGTAGASATLGLKMMWQVSKVAAVQMYATAVAAKVLAGAVGLLKGIMALLGGPAGLVMLVVYGLYKLIDSHNVAKRAANDHADTLAKLKEQMAETVKETNNLVTAQSKNQAIAEWSYKLKVAEKNIKDLKEELKDTGGLSFFQRHAPNMFLKEYQIFANDLADILSQSKYNLEEYQKEVWRLAAEYPDFQPQAKAIQEKFLLLKAAEIDAQKARDELQASTPLDARVLDKMLPFMTTEFGNPHSSEHFFGWKANDAIESAKGMVADYINALEDEIVFTSGATESNNLAIIGMGYTVLDKSKRRTILVSAIEHKCVLGASRFLERFGFTIKKIPVKHDGIIDFEALNELLTDDVLLVSTMATNNEIGVNQPLEKIGTMCKEKGAIFHVDAAQGAYANIDVVENHVDMLSLSGHKVYGPKGIGALYINQASELKPTPIIRGGGQQSGYRSGTMPTFLVVGMGEAFSLMKDLKDTEAQYISDLRAKLLDGLKAKFPDIKINGTMDSRHPGNLNVMLSNRDARDMILSLQPKIAFSTGSACTSGIQEPSHVLKAIGLTTEEAEHSFRITVGRFSNMDDINTAIELISGRN